MSGNRLLKRNVTLNGHANTGGTILFSHGFGTGQDVWATVAEPFRNDYKLVLRDLVGCRPETEPAFSPNRYDLNAWVDDLIELCDLARLKDVIFVGHSIAACQRGW